MSNEREMSSQVFIIKTMAHLVERHWDNNGKRVMRLKKECSVGKLLLGGGGIDVEMYSFKLCNIW